MTDLLKLMILHSDAKFPQVGCKVKQGFPDLEVAVDILGHTGPYWALPRVILGPPKVDVCLGGTMFPFTASWISGCLSSRWLCCLAPFLGEFGGDGTSWCKLGVMLLCIHHWPGFERNIYTVRSGPSDTWKIPRDPFGCDHFSICASP